MLSYINPYTDQDFFGFFACLFRRLLVFLSGTNPSLAADEIQLGVLLSIAASSALVGTFLVVRRQSMLANALSHTVLLGIVVAYLLFHALTLPALMIAALATALATCFLTDFLSRIIKLQEDASIGLIFTILFALGITLLSLFGRDSHLGTELVLGNVDALQKEDLFFSLAILGFNGLIFFFLFRGFCLTTFDPGLARTLGFSPTLFSYVLILLASLSTISGLRSVGVLMVVAFFVLPPLTARLVVCRLIPMIGLAAFFGGLSALIGVALSRHILSFTGLGLSTGGIVVSVMGLFYLGTMGLKRALTIHRLQAIISPWKRRSSRKGLGVGA